jgi:hypothetical protein
MLVGHIEIVHSANDCYNDSLWANRIAVLDHLGEMRVYLTYERQVSSSSSLPYMCVFGRNVRP